MSSSWPKSTCCNAARRRAIEAAAVDASVSLRGDAEVIIGILYVSFWFCGALKKLVTTLRMTAANQSHFPWSRYSAGRLRSFEIPLQRFTLTWQQRVLPYSRAAITRVLHSAAFLRTGVGVLVDV